MDANNIKYFVAVAKYGSINHAAKAMFISQPQLSHIIKSIEEETGLILFQRTSQGTKLTQDGKDFLHHCEVIMREMENLKRFVSEAKEEKSRLSVSMTRFSHTAECFNEISSRHQNDQNISFKLREDAMMGVVDDVAEGLSNVGVIHFSAADTELVLRNLKEKKLDYVALANFRPYVCLSSSHEILEKAGRDGIEAKDLQNYGFVRYIGQYEDFIYHIATEGGLLDLNESEKIIYVNDRQEQMRLISKTNFYTIGILEFGGQNSLYDVISVPLRDSSEHLKFAIITRKGAVLSAIEEEFIAYVREHYRRLQEKEANV